MYIILKIYCYKQTLKRSIYKTFPHKRFQHERFQHEMFPHKLFSNKTFSSQRFLPQNIFLHKMFPLLNISTTKCFLSQNISYTECFLNNMFPASFLTLHFHHKTFPAAKLDVTFNKKYNLSYISFKKCFLSQNISILQNMNYSKNFHQKNVSSV